MSKIIQKKELSFRNLLCEIQKTTFEKTDLRVGNNLDSEVIL